MNNINPFLCTDGYKVAHHKMYPENTTLVYSNFTPRANKYAPEGCDYVVSFGQQMVMRQIHEMFDNHFFRKDILTDSVKKIGLANPKGEMGVFVSNIKNKVCEEIKKEYSLYLGCDYDVSHIEALWDLGYLPIKVKAIPEGTKVPIKTPVLTVYNTLPEFYWLTNFLETLISNLLWKPITSATIADKFKRDLTEWAKRTDEKNVGFVEFQGHDFSMRGMDSIGATISSGLGHATSFRGSDSLPVIHGARQYYDAEDAVVHSVNATEHSVMCAGSKGDELGTFRYLMNQFPTGILSVVSDTWDLWKVITEYLPTLKDEIMARDGKITIRPDSGDPVAIICGHSRAKIEDAIPYNEDHKRMGIDSENEYKGVIELLWDIFGGTTNEQGYKVLDPHIGAIYGDSINIERANEICRRLEAKGFASTNVVLGIGSFTYQFNTRDTFGFAMKATYVEIDGVGREIFKDPITDDGTKKSAKGILRVDVVNDYGQGGQIQVFDQQNWTQEGTGILRTIFNNGDFVNQVDLEGVRERLAAQ